MTQTLSHSFEDVTLFLNTKVITTSYQDISYVMVSVCWVPTGILASIFLCDFGYCMLVMTIATAFPKELQPRCSLSVIGNY